MRETMEADTRLRHAERVERVRERWLDITFLAGLAGVFLVNALNALLQPGDFSALVEASAVGRWLDLDGSGWVGPVIATNDFLLGLGLLTGIWLPRIRMVVLAWAGVWLLGVTLIRMTALEAFPW